VPKTANKVSFLIESQLPDFINEEYELFSKFVQKYYEQNELQGQPLDIISNIQQYRDIDFYEKNVLKQSTTTTSYVQDVDTSINVTDASSFPKNGGYIKIDDEICFYKSRTDTQLLEVSRGVSGNTKIGDLYEESTFVTTQTDNHILGSTVQNISNLFLYSLIKSFEKQYLDNFPEAYLKGDIDKRTLIKNITSFYKSKGTDSSVKFLFKCLIDNDPEPTILYPREHTLKSSESTWINNYSIKAKILSGDVNNLIGKKITQTTGKFASAVVDNVIFTGKFDGEDLYELILSESSVNGRFTVASKTILTKDVGATLSVGGRVNVFSTIGWENEGKFTIDNEVFTFDDKNVNQFVVKSRTSNGAYSVGDAVTFGSDVSGNGVSLLVYGIVYNLESNNKVPYSNTGDSIDISESGFLTDDIRIFDDQNSLRWTIGGSTPAIADLNSNVSAIYEDVDSYYIASSGFPSHAIGTLPSDAADQKHLKIIRKKPISTTESYETQFRDVGIATNGIPFLSYKDDEVILNGGLQKITLDKKGNGYKKPPFVLIDGVANQATTKLAGEVVQSVSIVTEGSYTSVPSVEILSGRNATVTAIITQGEITSITIDNAGEYYSSPPEVRIADLAGRGQFAVYTSEVSNAGQLTNLVKVNGGKGYTSGNVLIDIIPVGSGATATAGIKEWRKDRFKKTTVDSENGTFFSNFTASVGQGYGYLASPTTLRTNDTGASHSPILGFAYDGNPIYGAYGYSDALDASSSVSKMTSSYMPVTTRVGGPDETTYPIGTFIEDWVYVHDRGSLDRNNGRYCITPEFPNGTYAYFITCDGTDTPVFPYVVGKCYYSLPVDSNYNSTLNQYDLPTNAKRLRTTDIENNGDGTSLQIQDVTTGSISSATVETSSATFSVGSELIIDESGTGGSDVKAEVDSVTGKSVISIESQTDKVLFVSLTSNAYLFDGDRVTQGSATGRIVGNVFSATKFPIRSVTGTWSATGTLTSDTEVLTLLLDQNASYTKGAILSLNDGVNLPVAKGEVLETTSSQNSVKVKVTQTGFTISSTLFLSSSDLLNTPGSKIISITSLSENLGINTIQDNVALLSTGSNHGVAEGEKITVDVNPNDTSTTTELQVTSAVYQEAILETPVVATTLNDSGVGRFEILNGGNNYTVGQYNDIALSGGKGSGAKASIKVEQIGNNTPVTEVVITDRGSGYEKFDILTVGDSDLNKTDTNEPRLQISVDHAGFSKERTDLIVTSAIGFSVNDKLVIGSEVVTITSITSNTFTVTRGSKPADHFNGVTITLQDAGFTLSSGYLINQYSGSDLTQPYVVSYDTTTQKVVFKYGYGVTPSLLTLSSVFRDQSQPANRLVNIASVSEPITAFEIDGERNKIVNIKNYYKYKFNVSHSSMIGKKFDISPSINFNIVAVEKEIPNLSEVNIKVGFGSRTYNNTYSSKVNSQYNKFYYFDQNNIVNAEGSYLNVIDDDLQGEKTALYVTPTKILYSTVNPVTHDGTGSISYTTKSLFAVGNINSIRVTNVGGNYKKLPIVTGIINSEGNIDNTVKCYLSSNDIGIPSNIKIISNGGLYHNDTSLQSTFRSNNIFTLSDFNEKPFSVGETIIQKSGSVEVARARVTSWTEGTNILIVDKVTGIFRIDQNIIGLARNQIAKLKSISFTEFLPTIQTDFDNVGFYSSDAGKLSDANQRLHDSYYYQDFSYTIKSKTSTDTWRQLIKETTHPAGFQLFGEVVIESEVDAKMTDNTAMSRVSVIQAWDPSKNKITVESVRKQITQNIILMDNLNVEKGVGSVALDAINTSEIIGEEVYLNAAFNGSFGNKGNREGQKQFTLVDINNNAITPFNDQALVITLDGILQEPGKAYTILNDNITFAEAPLTGVTFYANKFQFKTSALNNKYLKKIRNIFQRNGRWLDASNQIERNKEFIQESTLAHIKTVHPTLAWNSLSTKCFRDIGFIVDALAHDIRFGGNEKTIVSLEKYFNNGILDYIDGELEPTIEAFQYAVGLAKQAINNELSGGFADSDILTDNGPIKCADVLAALDTLSEVIRVILTTGPGSVTLGYPDYFNGENTIFDLFYTDGTPVDTEENEDLWIALSGVLQVGDSYTIDRTNIPNRIIFSTPPIWGQSKNTKTVYEGLAVERFFGQGIGSYDKLTISITNAGTGPFLIVDKNTEIRSLNNTTFVYVFIDGILQRETKSYTISGPSIRFHKEISPENNVDIISLYGRDSETTLTLFDYERNQYYNELKLTCDAGSPNDFINWISWYNLSHNDHQVAYQKVGGVKKYIGNVKVYTKTANTLIVTIAGSNQTLDASNIFFAGKPDFSDEYELDGTTDTLVPVKDGFNENQMQRNSARWLYGTPKGDEAFFERKRGGANLISNDLIKIDGETEFRTVNKLPRYVNPKSYNVDSDVSNDFYGPLLVSKYSGDTRGIGLSVECTVTNGNVTNVTWNKDAGAINGYDSTPVLHFIPENRQGGGARAEVIVQGGIVVDIVITDSGSGYTTAPRVVVSRQFKVIKKNGRKIDSLIELGFENNLLVTNLSVVSDITPIKGVEGGGGGGGGGIIGPTLPGDPDNPSHMIPSWAQSDWIGSLTLIEKEIELGFTLPAPVAIPQEITRYYPTVVDSVRLPDTNLTSQGMSILELGAYNVQCGFSTFIDLDRPSGGRRPGPPDGGGGGGGGGGTTPGDNVTTYQMGFVDHRFYNPSYNSSPPPLHNTTMRPAFFMWEGAKFMDTGDILSPAGHSVSEYTIEEFDRYGFQLLEFSDFAGSGWANDGYSMNVAYPTINNYLTQLDTTDLPDENGAGYVASGAVVYTNTTNFPASGNILIGKETISYTSKLSDRFIGCTRGANGSPIESHTVSDFIRSAN